MTFPPDDLLDDIKRRVELAYEASVDDADIGNIDWSCYSVLGTVLRDLRGMIDQVQVSA